MTFLQKHLTVLAAVLTIFFIFSNTDEAYAEKTLYTFSGRPDASYPQSGLIQDTSGALYGTTLYGGTQNLGAVYKLVPSGPGNSDWSESVLFSFTADAVGLHPFGRLAFGQDGALYGIDWAGKAGVAFRLAPPETGQTTWTAAPIFTFSSDGGGTFPASGLTAGADGNLYGATDASDEQGQTGYIANSIIFKLSPPAQGSTAWKENVLYQFSDPNSVSSEIVIDTSGALYGTRCGGVTAATKSGEIFKLTPPSAPSDDWTETTIYEFSGPDGKCPVGVTVAEDGTIYGTTSAGGITYAPQSGIEGDGTVFRLVPPTTGQTAWSELVIHNFSGRNGVAPPSSVTIGPKGDLYGVTSAGGSRFCEINALGCGIVYKLTPLGKAKKKWTGTILFDFGTNDSGIGRKNYSGGNPIGDLLIGTDGKLYGVILDSLIGDGLIFRTTRTP